MKKILLIIGCILLVTTACKKDKNNIPSNTISADIDGVNETFNINAFAQIGSVLIANSSLSLFGYHDNTANPDEMSITMAINKTITTSSYVSGNDNVGFVSIQYQKSLSSLTNLNSYATDPDGSPSTVIITLLSSTNVQGTFSGKLVYGSLTKTITNGKFNLPLKK